MPGPLETVREYSPKGGPGWWRVGRCGEAGSVDVRPGRAGEKPMQVLEARPGERRHLVLCVCEGVCV